MLDIYTLHWELGGLFNYKPKSSHRQRLRTRNWYVPRSQETCPCSIFHLTYSMNLSSAVISVLLLINQGDLYNIQNIQIFIHTKLDTNKFTNSKFRISVDIKTTWIFIFAELSSATKIRISIVHKDDFEITWIFIFCREELCN